MCYFKCLTRNNINILNLLFGKNSTYTKLISYMNLLLFLKAGGVKDIVLLSYGPFYLILTGLLAMSKNPLHHKDDKKSV